MKGELSCIWVNQVPCPIRTIIRFKSLEFNLSFVDDISNVCLILYTCRIAHLSLPYYLYYLYNTLAHSCLHTLFTYTLYSFLCNNSKNYLQVQYCGANFFVLLLRPTQVWESSHQLSLFTGWDTLGWLLRIRAPSKRIAKAPHYRDNPGLVIERWPTCGQEQGQYFHSKFLGDLTK